MRHPDVVRGAVDRLEVHRPDREHPQPGHVAVHPDPGLPVGRGLQQQGAYAVPGPPVQVPEVGEGPGQVEHPRPGDPHVRVAPLGGVGGADVVAAHEPDPVVHDEDLAVVAAVAPQVEEAQPGVVDGVLQHLEPRAEPLEHRRDHEVREPVVDRVDLDPAAGGPAEGLLELLAGRVGLPDVGLEQDPVLGALDRGQHVVVQVLPERVRRDGALADRDLGRRRRGERLRPAPAPAAGVHQREDQGQQRAGAPARTESRAGRPRSACDGCSRQETYPVGAGS